MARFLLISCYKIAGCRIRQRSAWKRRWAEFVRLNVSVDALGLIRRERQKETARRIAGPFLFLERFMFRAGI
jgi:hypothetical protein